MTTRPIDVPAVDLPVDERLRTRPQDFDFFQAVQLLEKLQEARTSAPSNSGSTTEPVRFRALPSTTFPPSAIADLQPGKDEAHPPEMTVTFLGLTGPSGVLPRHYTELLMRLEREVRGPQKHALRDWLDQFNHRLVKLFYGAWKKYRFWVPFAKREYAAPQPDAFTHSVLSLAGLGQQALRNRLDGGGADRGDLAKFNAVKPAASGGISDLALMRYAGLFAQHRRSAGNLERLLRDYFRIPVEVQQFRGQWLQLDDEHRTRLGGKGFNQLGRDAVVGSRVWDLESKFRVRLGPLTGEQFSKFLPESSDSELSNLPPLRKIVRLFAGAALDFEVQLDLKNGDVPRTLISANTAHASRLGWNAWITTGTPPCDRDDAVFQDAFN